MKRLILASVLAVALVTCCQSRSHAQYVTYYSPVVSPTPVVVYRPVVATPVVAQPVVAAPQPVAYTVARPVVTTTVAPVAYTRTRWRPFLGGTVTRVRYGYAPVSYYGY